MSTDCVVCDALAGELEIPGGVLWEDAEVVAFHVLATEANPLPCLGHCMVVPRRHAQLGDLTGDEVESITAHQEYCSTRSGRRAWTARSSTRLAP